MIHLFGVSKIYPPDYPALVDVHLDVEKGEFLFLSGASGAGKSTLLSLLFRRQEATEGEIIVGGRNVRRLGARGIAELRRRIGLVFQDCKLLPALTALDNVALAAEAAGASAREGRRKAFHLLRELGLKEKHAARPPMLSAGERQKVAIARALVNDPMLVLADEPTGDLDPDAAEETMRLFSRIHEQGTTIVIATHDAALVRRFRHRVAALQNGRLLGESKRAAEFAL